MTKPTDTPSREPQRLSTWDALAALRLRIDGYALEGLERDVSSAFTRRSTVIRLRGGGEEGVGEDVTYDGDDHEALQAAGPSLPLAGDWTLASFCDHVEALDLWPRPARREASRHYRLWAYESAALDLALRQAGRPLHAVLGRKPRPVTFVVSMRLGEPATIEPVTRRLERHPSLRFKLDPTSDWTADLIAALRATGAVDSVDLKGLYEGTVVDQGADADLYRRVAEGLPDAWIEDPRLTPETDAVLAPHRARITWDANIHSVDDILGLPFPPRMVNVKPSRLGPLRSLLAAYDLCAERGIGMYGGGQFELGPGRGQIQYLASLFHPDAPNDVAPSPYNLPDLPDGLPTTPLEPPAEIRGFRWA
jgi:L-alanine-DL-glutamate epimerase-like enolase superfamily enzyme